MINSTAPGMSVATVLSPRSLMHDSVLPTWWQNTIEQVGQPDMSPDTPKPFLSAGDEASNEAMELPSSVKNYASLIKKAGPYILGRS